MIGISSDAKDDMLAVFAGKVYQLALFAGDEEITDSLYNRREVHFSQPVGEGEVRYVQNVEMVRFEGFNNRHLVDHWGAVGQDGQVKARYKTLDPETGAPMAIEVSPAMDCKFRPGQLRIGLP